MAPEVEKEYRAILTPREREIITGEADVADSYFYRVVSRVREKIERLEEDLNTFDEHHQQLAEEIRQTICGQDVDGSSPDT